MSSFSAENQRREISRNAEGIFLLDSQSVLFSINRRVIVFFLLEIVNFKMIGVVFLSVVGYLFN